LKEVTNSTIETLADEIVSRRKAEGDLQQSEEKYRTLFEKSADAMILYDENGFIDCNEAATKFFLAEKREDLLGKQPWEMSPQQQPDGRSSREEANEMIETAWKLGSHQFEWTHIRANGDPFPAEISLTAIPYQGKRLFRAICRDITERKLAEEVQRKLEAQLSEAQRLEALGTLAGGIAHDFNNTLVPIIGYTEIALDDVPENSPMRENLEKVLVSAERAKELIAQILTFSRQKEEQSARLRIAPAVKETLQLLRASLPATIEIPTHIEANEACVEAHPAQIHQIVMNLGTNAAHAREEQEHGVLEVSLEPADRLDGDDALGERPRLPPGAYVRLTISDTGCGMPPEVKERIFEPFFTTKQATGGTGMGLSLVHGIVKKLGGAVYVHSEPGDGTTFEIFLPRLPVETHAATEPARREFRGGTERILFVDDEELQVDFWTRALGRLGYDVVAMLSSVDAVETFEADPAAFDLVITDQTMPHLTGESLARRLLELRPGLPIILCTGFSKSVTPENVAAMGIRALLMKPCGIQKMNETIRQALEETCEPGADPAEDEGLPRVVEARPGAPS
jgi:PAS domain S-box-containing protein